MKQKCISTFSSLVIVSRPFKLLWYGLNIKVREKRLSCRDKNILFWYKWFHSHILCFVAHLLLYSCIVCTYWIYSRHQVGKSGILFMVRKGDICPRPWWIRASAVKTRFQPQKIQVSAVKTSFSAAMTPFSAVYDNYASFDTKI